MISLAAKPMARVPEVPHHDGVAGAVSALRAGRMAVVLTGDGDFAVGHLVIGARHATPEAVNFMAVHGRGVVSLALSQADIVRLQLPMQRRGAGPEGRDAPVSIEARTGVSTGISAADRARTILVADDPSSGPDDLVSPGHIFPLLAKEGGVFALRGPAEAAVDLCRLAGLPGRAAICAVLDETGRQAQPDRLNAFSREHGLPIATGQQVFDYRRRFDRHIEVVRQERLMTRIGPVRATVFRSLADGAEALAIVTDTERPIGAAPVWLQHGLSLREQLGVADPVRGLCQALQRIDELGHGAVLILGHSAGGALSSLLAERDSTERLSDEDGALAARVLTELGFDDVHLLNQPGETATMLTRLGLRATVA